ncbi:MAG: hypothetical protein L0Y68_08640 [Candidatus Dadabacteria bacterium]|nr:hypothetical protein [Candidatus Dadabacteria bacterium]
MKEFFDFYGLTVEINSPSADLVEGIRRDFAYFHVPTVEKGVQVQVQMYLDPPPYAGLPPLSASLITPRNVCFQNKKITYIDYFGRGLVMFNREKKQCTVYGTEPDLVREISYLFILSTVGQYLDSRGIHRVHALGVSYNKRGILLLLPAGGGKSTIALELLRHPGFLLLGEDTPLIDRRGRILPFLLRLGVRPEQDTGISPQYLRTVQRMEFDPKTLVDIEYFHDRLGKEVEPGLILVGERNLGEVSEITPLARHQALKALVKYMVVGLGIYQGMEFLLERGLWELLGKGGVAASRFYNSLRLIARVPAFRFVLGRSSKKNCQTLVDFIHQTYD